jgi:hypothetical protein
VVVPPMPPGSAKSRTNSLWTCLTVSQRSFPSRSAWPGRSPTACSPGPVCSGPRRPPPSCPACLPGLVLAVGTALAHMLRADADTTADRPSDGTADASLCHLPGPPGTRADRSGTRPCPGAAVRIRSGGGCSFGGRWRLLLLMPAESTCRATIAGYSKATGSTRMVPCATRPDSRSDLAGFAERRIVSSLSGRHPWSAARRNGSGARPASARRVPAGACR